ncbi:Two-component transcriptional response regulator, LuxR family [hydrothermal vent metagenome]|uniref:Two-component transcriptional response regulator, LuxR family n=1 Tax=hydrothermal vent metagenome TaxID=652676 RepID=A0A3B0YI71_9ZZZZ
MAYGLTQILLLENTAGAQAMTKLTLETLGGFQIWTASEGNEVLNILQYNRPDLIILDEDMHENMQATDDSSAYRIVQEVFNDNPVPTIFMTSREINSSTDRFAKAGAIAVISKPFDPMTLSSLIENIWKSWHIAV